MAYLANMEEGDQKVAVSPKADLFLWKKNQINGHQNMSFLQKHRAKD